MRAGRDRAAPLRRAVAGAPARPRRWFGTPPQWADALRAAAAEDAGKAVSYDICVRDDLLWRAAPFAFSENCWPQDLPELTRQALCGGEVGKEYVCIGEAFAFPDSEDNPVVNDPSHPAKLWWDPSSPAERLLVQLGPHLPPALWIPLKPEHGALRRLFSDCTTLDAVHMERYLPVFERLQQQAEASTGSTLADQSKGGGLARKASERFRDDLRSGTVSSLRRDYPHTAVVSLGCCSHPLHVERRLSAKVKGQPANPFVFAWPLLQIEGGEQEEWTNRRVHSAFRTVYSKSLIVLESRMDLLPDPDRPELPALASDGEIPLFAVLNYPDAPRLSGGPGVLRRANAALGADFPQGAPVDLVAALAQFPVLGAARLATRLDEQLDALSAAVRGSASRAERRALAAAAASGAVALAAVGPADFAQRVERAAGSPEGVVRLAAFAGCHDAELTELRDAARAAERDDAVREAMDRHVLVAGAPSDFRLREHDSSSATPLPPEAAAAA
eukprot:TRINITY_DN65354_c0_g1_i1.p1 TRINITY_DN65354_c0_g1~~TRINITY_DN65354_c0_g1_i1.p1  ORF type:complete len:502 (+),score=162.74 TRINITY_DN65354_c0_g1_i1:71-1576(+)